MEYLKSLPYDSLAVAGGAIVTANPLPATVTKKLDGVTYTVRTSINYVDDAYDGCGSYPNGTLKAQYCHNQPAPAGAPATDLNPADYKLAAVRVSGPGGNTIAEVDTQIAARVSETASTTGALFVKVVDGAGNPVSGATIQVVNATVTPNVSASDSSDSNGVAIFYGLPPDNGTDYKITASETGYSSLATIVAAGALQPTYPNQKVLTQQSSFVTLTIKQQGANSLVLETTDTSGTALGNVKVYLKGGYKKYTATTDTAYYYDTMTPSDTRPTTDASGFASVSNLVPGPYYVCGDSGSTSCSIGGTTYYLTAAVPYGGTSPFLPINIPTDDPDNPPATTFTYNGSEFLQKVRLMLTTNANFPRVTLIAPGTVHTGSDPLSSFPFNITGVNIPCANTAASCGTSIKIMQGATTYTASCTGPNITTVNKINCTVNLTGITSGNTTMTITSAGNTLALPGSPLIGGFVVSQ
jgi:hypothetical protein